MLAVPLFGLPLAVPSVIIAGALLVDAEFHSQYRSCDHFNRVHQEGSMAVAIVPRPLLCDFTFAIVSASSYFLRCLRASGN